MNFKKIKSIHIIGIAGCASSAIAELLINNAVMVTGSEIKQRDGLTYLEKKGIKIFYSHNKKNLYLNKSLPDIVLYSPAVIALDPNNPELIEAKKLNIPLMSWQNFIGDYLNSKGKLGITVCGSEGKGTTAGILTTILKDTEWDPLSILGAKIKKINTGNDSNIYYGTGNAYILEGDEYNRNFHNYHPAISIMVNFQYEHPETYKNFDEYRESFYVFFNGMKGEKILILRAAKNIIDFVNEYNLQKNHPITWYGNENEIQNIKTNYTIKNHTISAKGNIFTLKSNEEEINFNLPILPGYMIYNAAGAIIASLKLGLSIKQIKKNILRFKGMVRRFDIYKTKKNGIIITDYGHSPQAINHIIKEIRSIFIHKKIHLIFQPHLFSRTYNFFNEFINALKKADKLSLIDIYPARENPLDWKEKISSYMLYEKLKNDGMNVFYAGKSHEIKNNLLDKIDEKEITCFLGAGDMDLYYTAILGSLEARSCL